MAKASKHLSHPVLGDLVWMPKCSFWAVRTSHPSGGEFDVIVNPSGGDRFEFLPRATELYQWAMANERQVLVKAMKAELLELYNDDWRQRGQPKLTAKKLVARLEWQMLEVKADSPAPIEFSYFGGDLFGKHVVTVQVDEALQFLDVDLRG